MSTKDFDEFSAHLATLKKLVKKLPTSVPLAKANSRICEVFKSIPVPTNPIDHWETFDKRGNALFPEDGRVDGRLPNMERGKHGLDMVVKYFEDAASAGSLQWAAAIPKVTRLVDEVKWIIVNAKKKTTSTAAAMTSSKKRKKATNSGSDTEDDPSYATPKRGGKDDEFDPEQLYDTDGSEVAEDCEYEEHLKKKRSNKKAQKEADTIVEPSEPPKKKKKTGGKKGSKSKKKGSKEKTIDLTGDRDSADEDEESDSSSCSHSDGGGAARREAAASRPNKRRGPPNQTIEHYETAKATEAPDGQWRWEFPCRYCESIRTVPRTLEDDGINTFDDEPHLPLLTNLATHISKCKGKQTFDKKKAKKAAAAADNSELTFNYRETSKIMEKFLKEGKINPAVVPSQAGFTRIFSAWIFDEGLPWTTGEAPLLRDLFKYLKVNFYLPTDTTVRNQLGRMFIELRNELVKQFATIRSKIAYSTDTWTNKQMWYTFAATIAHFVDDDWDLIERVIDFKPLESKDHEGLYAARALVAGAREVGGLDKMTLVTDGASVNGTIFHHTARTLLRLYSIPNNPDRHLHCLAHIINLVAQAILAELKEVVGYDEDDPLADEGDDSYLQSKDSAIHYNVDDDEDLRELEGNRKEDMEAADEPDPYDDDDVLGVESELDEVGGSALQKLRFLVTKICSSPQRRQRFWKNSERKYGDARSDPNDPTSTLLRLLMVIKDVRTRWNSTHAMISRALLLADAIDDWAYDTKEYRSLGLTSREWDTLRVMCTILEPFSDATKILSMSRIPTIPFVFPILTNIEGHLNDVLGDPQVSTTIRSAVAVGKAKLLKYKAKANTNHTLIVGTILHPSLRAEWFRKNVPLNTNQERLRKAQEEEVERVKIIFNSVAQKYQRDALAAQASEATCTSDAPAPTVVPLARSGSGSRLLSVFSVDYTPPPTQTRRTAAQELDDELERYYGFEGGPAELMNPLGWWKTHHTLFPTLAAMAKDYLPIPATSVSVERLFSKSRHICTDLRSSLRAVTVREALLTKVWIRSGLFELVPKPKPFVKHGDPSLLRK